MDETINDQESSLHSLDYFRMPGAFLVHITRLLVTFLVSLHSFMP